MKKNWKLLIVTGISIIAATFVSFSIFDNKKEMSFHPIEAQTAEEFQIKCGCSYFNTGDCSALNNGPTCAGGINTNVHCDEYDGNC